MCGTKFVPSKFRTNNQKYCSSICRYENWKKNHRLQILLAIKKWKKEHRDKVNSWQRKWFHSKRLENARETWKEIPCRECKKMFLPNFGNRNQQIYCSIKCREKWNRKWVNLTEHAKARKRHDVSNRKHIVRANGGRFTLQEWEQIKKDYNYTCIGCGRKEPEIKLVRDHIFPIAKGGKHCRENIQPLCISCNCKKRDRIDFVPCIRHTVHVNP